MQAERLKFLLEFLEQEPNEPFNIYAVAMEYLNSDKKTALFYLEKLSAEHENYLPTYYHLAAIYTEFGENEKAVEIYKKGIKIAEKQGKINALRELRGALQQLLDEMEE